MEDFMIVGKNEQVIQGIPTGKLNDLDKRVKTLEQSSGAGTPAVSVTDETTYGITPAVGVSTNYARQDHTHGTPATPTKTTVGLGNVVNLDTSTTSNITDSLNKRFVTDANLTTIGNQSGTNTGDQTGGTPAITLGTANTAGVSTNFLRRDDTILAFDATSPSTQAFADAASVGVATVAARRDHKHAMMAAPTTITGNAGTATALQNARTIGTLTGDVTSAGSSFDGTANNTNATTVTKINGTLMSGLATGILKNTTATGVPSIATNADLPVMSATVGGAVPTPPNNTTTFLRGDGTFAAPPGGSTPTGTGFTHITAGVQDAAAQLVGIADHSATGTPSASTYYRGDNTWATVTAAQPSLAQSLLSQVVDTTITAGYSVTLGMRYTIASGTRLTIGLSGRLKVI